MAAACDICTQGSFCEGADFPETSCLAGYFCPPGTKFATQFPCPAGTYSTGAATSKDDC